MIDGTFDRFDICEAYYLVEVDYHLNGWLQERPSNVRRREATHVQLARIEFKPAPTISYANLTENGRAIYDEQVRRLKLPVEA